jgi:mannitol-1-phosphate/altronate dehydrogenase
MKKKLLVYGAGAIGRGYVPWLFNSKDFEISFVESDIDLRSKLQERKQYTTYKTTNDKYESLICSFNECLDLGEENITEYDGIITAVGPRKVFSLEKALSQTDCPIILFENDASLAIQLRNNLKKNNIFFGVPDVITSNTAPQSMLDNDPLSIVTEDGECFVENGAKTIGGNISYVSQEEIEKQWTAKLYIHNTPHCIAAYLGAMNERQYLHEGMENETIYKIVEGAMNEMSQTIIKLYNIDESFVNWYSKKELSRFSNKLLYDPISRVAREPFRKLGLHDRLIGASQLALSVGIIPENLVLGTIAAFLYDEEKDEDSHIKTLIRSLKKEKFLELIINIQPHEALYKIFMRKWDKSIDILREIEV